VPATILRVPSVHSDERRDIAEVEYAFPSAVRKTVLAVKGVVSLGNHYHRELTETFLLAQGEAHLLTRDVDAEGSATATIEKQTLVAPVVIVMPPFTAHCFQFSGPAVLICDSDKPFDKNDLLPFAFN